MYSLDEVDAALSARMLFSLEILLSKARKDPPNSGSVGVRAHSRSRGSVSRVQQQEMSAEKKEVTSLKERLAPDTLAYADVGNYSFAGAASYAGHRLVLVVESSQFSRLPIMPSELSQQVQ